VESLGAGYACVTMQLPPSSQTLRLANVTPTRLRGLIQPIPSALEAILRWNEQNGIGVLRLTSNVNHFAARVPAVQVPSRQAPAAQSGICAAASVVYCMSILCSARRGAA